MRYFDVGEERDAPQVQQQPVRTAPARAPRAHRAPVQTQAPATRSRFAETEESEEWEEF